MRKDYLCKAHILYKHQNGKGLNYSLIDSYSYESEYHIDTKYYTMIKDEYKDIYLEYITTPSELLI